MTEYQVAWITEEATKRAPFVAVVKANFPAAVTRITSVRLWPSGDFYYLLLGSRPIRLTAKSARFLFEIRSVFDSLEPFSVTRFTGFLVCRVPLPAVRSNSLGVQLSVFLGGGCLLFAPLNCLCLFVHVSSHLFRSDHAAYQVAARWAVRLGLLGVFVDGDDVHAKHFRQPLGWVVGLVGGVPSSGARALVSRFWKCLHLDHLVSAQPVGELVWAVDE
jgi:hypothetical protein